MKKIANIYPSQGQNGDVYATNGVSPTLRSGQGIVGRGVGSCNSPKILLVYESELHYDTSVEQAE